MSEKSAATLAARQSLPFGERDTLQAIEETVVVHPLQPSIKEHGVWSTSSEAVGGFGESYDAQVARGSEPDLPAGAAGGAPEDALLEREVRKTLGRAHVDAADLRVLVQGDHVTLSGSVRQALEKAQIEARARAVPGVGSVTSRISVQEAPPEPG